MTSVKRQTLAERFSNRYQEDDSTGCWNWTGHLRGTSGYGAVTYNYKLLSAHRVSWELLRGPIPAGLVIDHLCGNRRCVNPDHLEPVTQRENVRRAKARVSHCPAGHPYDNQNTYTHNGKRQCVECGRRRSRERQRAIRQTQRDIRGLREAS